MKQVRVSDGAHAKIMNNFDKDLRTVWQVVDVLIDVGDAVTVNEMNGVDEVNGVDVDYSQCPNCEKLQEQLGAQDDTIEGLGHKYDMVAKANSDAHDEYVKLNTKYEELNTMYEELKAKTTSGN